MEAYAIETRGVSRSFAKRLALRELNLRVRQGSIYGLLGRNGSGKTTVIKLLAGLIWPDNGRISVHGVAPDQFSVQDRRQIGYVSERQLLNPFFRVKTLIRFTSNFYPHWDDATCERLLRRFKIDPAARIGSLSLGQARQVSVILALAPRPDLLLLDEPAANLDVVARRMFLDELLTVLREDGKTVLISSHILSDIERVADEVGIIDQGSLKISESLDRLKETVKQVRFYGFQGGTNGFEISGAFRLRKTPDEALATLRVEDENMLPRLAASSRCRYQISDLNLEDIFVDIVGEGGGIQ